MSYPRIIRSCRLALVTAALCGCSDEAPTPASDAAVEAGAPDGATVSPPDAATADAPPTDAGSMLTVTVESYDSASGRVTPLADAVVAVDPPGAARVEATTDAAGRAVFPSLDGSLGADAITAYKRGYSLTTRLGVDGARSALRLSVFPLPSTARVSGRTLDPRSSSSTFYYSFTATYGGLTTDGAGYAAQVTTGVPFTMLVTEFGPGLPMLGVFGFSSTLLRNVSFERAALSADTQLDLDLRTGTAVATENFSATMRVDPEVGASLDGAFFAYVRNFIAGGIEYGTTLDSFSTDQENYTIAAFRSVLPAVVGRRLVQAKVESTTVGGESTITRDATTADLSFTDFLPVPRWASEETSHALGEPFELAAVAPGVAVGVALRTRSAIVWRAFAPAGTTSLRLPAPPAAATRDGALDGVVGAVPALCESTVADPLCRRGAVGRGLAIAR